MPSSASETVDAPSLPSILVGVLGRFRLTVHDALVPISNHSKAEDLLVMLAMCRQHRTERSELLDAVWPSVDPALRGQSLNTLTHHLNKVVAERHGAATLILQDAGYYQLARGPVVAVDIDLFDRWAARGRRALASGDRDGGLALCERAIALYRGDLCYGPHAKALNERERLRVGVLDLLALVSEQHYRQGDIVRALGWLDRLLDLDFLREDAQRLAMRCHTRLGHRSQALRQYAILRTELAKEFEAEPEASTTALYELIKHDPEALG